MSPAVLTAGSVQNSHTGRDPRNADDEHGCYDHTQWGVSAALAATASTAAGCQHDPSLKHNLHGTCLPKSDEHVAATF